MQLARRRRDAPRPEGAADRDAVLRGVGGAVLCAVAVAALWVVTVPAYWPVDELSHVAYARSVAEGRLPTIHTPIDPTGMPGMAERLAFERAAGRNDREDVWTANHPPLYFLLAGVPLRIGETVAAPGLGFLGARALSLLAAAAGVALTAAAARMLVPQRPRIVVAAAAFAALTPSLGHFSGLVFNDSLSFAVCTALLICALLALRDGSRRWVLAVAGVGAVAALTRVAALPLIALAVVACAAGAWHRAADPVQRWRAAVRAGGIAAVVPVLGAGWFYWRNWRLYGDLTGTRALLEKFDRAPNGELQQLLLGTDFYVRQWDRLLGDLATGPIWTDGWRIVVIRGLGMAILAGLAVAAVRWVRRRQSPGYGRRRDPVARPVGSLPVAVPAPGWVEGGWRSSAWFLALAFPAGLLLATARFHAQGGSAHARYLLSALAVIALLSALGLEALDRRGNGWPTLGGLGALVVLGLGVWLEFLDHGETVWTEDGRLFPLLRIGGSWQEPAVMLALIVLAAGVLLVSRSLLDLADPSSLNDVR